MKNKAIKFPLLLCIFVILFFTLSAQAQDIFVLDDGNARLYKGDATTPGQVEILQSTIGRVGGIAINNISSGVSDIYYTKNSNSQSSGQIVRVNRDGTNQTTVASNLSLPTGLAIDVSINMLYFVQTITNIPAIYKVPTSGGTPVQVILGDGTGGPVDVAVDGGSGMIYWTDSRTYKIRRAQNDGTGEEVVTTTLSPPLSGIVFDSIGNQVYWVESATQTIRVASMGGTLPASPSTAVSSPLITLGGLDFDNSVSTVNFYVACNNSTVVKAPLGGTASILINVNDGAAQPVDLAISYSSIATPTPTTTPVSTVLGPETQLTSAPSVSVSTKTATITLQNFTSAVNSANSKRASNPKLVVRYDVKISAPKKADNRKILSKKNTLTLKNLKPGNYSVSYSAVAYTKKSKTQIDKAKSQGKTGFTSTYKKVFSTNISPSAGFTIQ